MLEVGDVVCLKSNPKVLMTVSFVLGKTELNGFVAKRFEKQWRELGFTDGDVQCGWFDNLEYKIEFFKAAMLVKK